MNSPRQSPAHPYRAALLPLTVTAIGVVYGDIGTSVLYTMRECFFGEHGVPPTAENVLGVLSLIVYALLLIVSVKYITVVMRADNQGEGGILALTALIPPRQAPGANRAHTTPIFVGLGLFGAALLYGDGMITPAITVLGAVEGLDVATPFFRPYLVPIAIGILIGLFLIQKRGTDKVGKLFGPVMIVWFAVLAVMGVHWIVQQPHVLTSVDPRHAITFFRTHGFHAFVVMGSVFLAVTGAEALYADMGHFGKRPIRLAWFALVLPALLLNYFGQGALLLTDPAAAANPFFNLAPAWALYPLVALATMAAIIASQALISGAFSLTRQAIQLGYCPRLNIDHTSAKEVGQVYLPQVNWALMVATVLIVVGFRSSTNLAAAYGIAVTMTMVITAILLYVVATERWRWSRLLAGAVAGVFLVIDGAFFGANLLKVIHGGWLPLVIAMAIFTLMTTWKTGRRIVAERITERAVPLARFLAEVAAHPPARVPGTAVFMTAQRIGTPPALAHNLRHNKVLHEEVVILTVTTAPIPYVEPADQVERVEQVGDGVFVVTLRYGFMQDPDVPGALALAQAEKGLPPCGDDVTYFLGRETLIVTEREGMSLWREQLFVLMSRNAQRATAFFRLPPERVVELGVQVEM